MSVYLNQAQPVLTPEQAFQQTVLVAAEPVVQAAKVALRTTADVYANNGIDTANERIKSLKQYSDNCQPAAKGAAHASVDTSAEVFAAATKQVVRAQLDRAEQKFNVAVNDAIANAAAAAYPLAK